jgi:hypothetical protein
MSGLRSGIMIKVYGRKFGVDKPITPWVYLHGMLQDKNGFDLCLIAPMPTHDGIYDCEAVLSTGETYPSKLYLYFVPRYASTQFSMINRGLIVANEDSDENHDYAKKCFVTKRRYFLPDEVIARDKEE